MGEPASAACPQKGPLCWTRPCLAAGVAWAAQAACGLRRRRFASQSLGADGIAQASAGGSAETFLNFLQLPPEVLISVLRRFRRGDLCSLARCACLCKNLHEPCKPLLMRALLCQSCGMHILHPRDVRAPQGHEAFDIFEDGPAVLLRRMSVPALQELGAPRASALKCFRFRTPEESRTKLRRIHCRGCQLYLGERFLTCPQTGENSTVAATAICRAYLTEVDSEGPVGGDAEPLHCGGARRTRGNASDPCGQPLFLCNSVLSRQHCWSPPGGRIEQAWYINSFLDGSVQLGPSVRRPLAQGLMETADVTCSSCGGFVGWQFSKDLASGRNQNQVGRFGICVSSVLELQGVKDSMRLLADSDSEADSQQQSDQAQEEAASELGSASAFDLDQNVEMHETV